MGRVLRLGVGEQLVAEFPDDRLHRPGRRFAEGADRAAVDLIGHAFQRVDVGRAGFSGDEAVGNLLHPGRTFAARRALAAGFVGVERVQIVEHPRHLAGVVEHDHAAGACHRATRRERVEVHLDVPEIEILGRAVRALEFENLVTFQDLRRRTTGNDSLEFAPVLWSAAHVVEQLAHRDLADLDFEITGILHIARDTENPRAGVSSNSEFRVFVAAHADDVLHVAKRFHVVDDGRAHVEPERRREIRRLDSRVGTLAFERFDQAGFLAADVGARAAVDVDFHVEAGAQHVLAEEIVGARLFDRPLDDQRRFREFLADVDVGRLRPDRVGRDHHALDELVRVLVENVAVLECPRLGFIAVADQINRLGVVRRDERPFHSSREACAAAAAQAGLLHLLGDLLRLHREGLFQIIISPVAQVTVDRRIPALAVHILENKPVFAGVWLLGVSDHAGKSGTVLAGKPAKQNPILAKNRPLPQRFPTASVGLTPADTGGQQSDPAIRQHRLTACPLDQTAEIRAQARPPLFEKRQVSSGFRGGFHIRSR